jgi:hypothetical protein
LSDNAKILLFCAAVLALACTIVSFQIRAQVTCESEGGIPVRALSFPSFVQCVN